jgi:hypothetical protein
MRKRLASIGLVASILAYAGTGLICLIEKTFFSLISSGCGLFFLITRGTSRDEGVMLIRGLFLLTILLWFIGLAAGGLYLVATHSFESARSQAAGSKRAWTAIRLGMLHPLLFLFLIQVGHGRDPVCMSWIYLIATLEGITVLLFLVWRYAGTIRPITPNESRASGSTVVGPTVARALGTISLCTSVGGVIGPVWIAILLVIWLLFAPQLPHQGPGPEASARFRAGLSVCRFLFLILELAALGCGIASWRTAPGRIGLVISSLILILGVPIAWLIARVVSP